MHVVMRKEVFYSLLQFFVDGCVDRMMGGQNDGWMDTLKDRLPFLTISFNYVPKLIIIKLPFP
jgi:hypothetical protein